MRPLRIVARPFQVFDEIASQYKSNTTDVADLHSLSPQLAHGGSFEAG
jgi:hypothetical protein